jgi:hypothetical protein
MQHTHATLRTTMVDETLPTCRSGTGDPKRDGLASLGGTWQSRGMTQPAPNPPRAGGFAIALLAILGVVIGNHYGQATIGLLAGVGTGVAIALGLWLKDRR